MASTCEQHPRQQKRQRGTDQVKDCKVDGGNRNLETSTIKALRTSHKALLRMRVTVLRSIKSLARDRMPAHQRRAMENRFMDLAKQVTAAIAATNAAVADADNDGGSEVWTDRVALVSDAVILLAVAYRLEREINDVMEEREQLVATNKTTPRGLGQFVIHTTQFLFEFMSIPWRKDREDQE